MKNKDIAISISLMLFGWLVIVVGSSKGWNITSSKWDFSNTAQLGDSFRVVSSFMASVAAYFAFATYQSAKEEAKIAERRAAEPSFLNLLERRFDVLDRIRFTQMGSVGGKAQKIQHQGQEALDRIAATLVKIIIPLEEAELRKRKYKSFVSTHVTGLTNYHRFVFHIIAFAERQFASTNPGEKITKQDPSYTYVRLLRAQFSDSEMLLMALNSLYGDGYPKLKHYVERYALLNNMSKEHTTDYGLAELFDAGAFGLAESDSRNTATH